MRKTALRRLVSSSVAVVAAAAFVLASPVTTSLAKTGTWEINGGGGHASSKTGTWELAKTGTWEINGGGGRTGTWE